MKKKVWFPIWCATLVALAAAGVVVPASAAPPTAPATVLFSLDEPVQPVTVAYTTTAVATDVQFSLKTAAAMSTITGITACTVNAAAAPGATLTAGDVTVPLGAAGATAGAVVSCTVTAGLYSASALTLTASELNGIGTITATSTVQARMVATTFSTPVVQANGSPMVPTQPRRVGDVLSYSVTATTDADPALLTGAGRAGNTTNCSPGGVPGAGTVTCSVSRTLSQTDLIAGAVDLAVEVRQVGGGRIATFPQTVAVFAEHLVTVALTAPTGVSVGNVANLTVVAHNTGSSTLAGLTLGNLVSSEVTSATCSRQPETGPAVTGVVLPTTLGPGEILTCMVAHTALVDDVATPRQVTVRGTSFGPDSDFSNDDATINTDIDAISVASFMAVDPGVQLVSYAQPAAVVIPIATPSVAATATIDLSSDIAPVNPRLRLTLPAGLTVAGCVAVPATPDCDLAVLAGLPATLVAVEMTAAIADAGVDTTVPVRFVADGGIDLPLSAIEVRTFGVALDVTATDAPFDAGAVDTARFDVSIQLQPGAPQRVLLLGAPAGSSLSGCTAYSSATVPGAFDLNIVAPGSTVDCVLTVPVGDGPDAGLINVDLTAQDEVGSSVTTSSSSATARGAKLAILPGALPAVPAHGYSATGEGGRPNSFTMNVAVRTSGVSTITGLTASGMTCPTATLGESIRFAALVATPEVQCTVTHQVTAAEVLAGGVTLRFTADGIAFTTVDVHAEAEIFVPLDRESVRLTVSELSAPADGNKYAVGETVRLLVQVANDGTLPIDGINVTMTTGAGSTGSAPKFGRAASLGECARPSLAPAASYECTIAYTITGNDLGSLTQLAFVVTTAQGLRVANSVALAAQPAAPVAPAAADPATAPATDGSRPSGTLAFTGANTGRQVIFALLSIAMGVLALAVPRRRRFEN